MYVAYTAAHWPMHAKPADIAKYRGRYDVGYDAVRAARVEKLRRLGLLVCLNDFGAGAANFEYLSCLEVDIVKLDGTWLQAARAAAGGKLPVEEWLGHATFYRHMGLYAYRTDVLQKITQLPVSPLERVESLEQLRWIENGYRIKTVETEAEEGMCVDTPEDLEKAREYLRKVGTPD